jgi:hypothetical protein
MEDASLVRRFEGAGNLTGHAQRILDGHRTAQHVALHVLEDEIVRSDVVQLADMRMVQSRDSACFTLETIAVIGVQHLDGDRSAESSVDGSMHLAHATSAD